MSEAQIEAHFDSLGEADRAVRHLRGSGVAAERIERYAAGSDRRSMPESHHRPRRQKWLRGRSEPLAEAEDRDLPPGTHAIRIQIPEDHADAVSYIFRRLSPRRLHEHVEHLRPPTRREAVPEGSRTAEHEVISLRTG